MGSRGRSIRLRIYFLVAIPLVMMLALAGLFAVTSINSYRNVTRAPNLILATAEQSTKFTLFLQAERRAALVYLASPDSHTFSQYQAAVNATKAGATEFAAAMNSPAVTSVEDSQEAAAIAKMISDVNNMNQLRLGVEARKVPALKAFEAYSLIIGDEPLVFSAEAKSLSDSHAAIAGFGLIEVVQVREDLDQQDAIMAGALASGNLDPQLRAAFNQAAGRQTDEEMLYPHLLSPAELADYTRPMSTPQAKTADAAITQVQQAVEAGEPLSAIRMKGMSPSAWQGLTTAWSNASYQGGLSAAQAVLGYDQGVANNAKSRLIIVGALGLAGLLFTLIVTMLLAGSVNRRLSRLRRDAVVLATEHLPAVVARLRRGENVDVAAEAPPLRGGKDEIGQVGQAIDMVRQTALRSAVEESRLRTGVNDMFRNLARRNQSLLQRQLTMLDGMERRATDPDVLDDLFKMDHLTTRMRRHAEGLIILSGAAPGRGWSTPVKLIDVMRGAVAEVEDFARVIVTTQSKAALTGSAVTDVIHLLAELIENATTLSPPFTQVRVHGEMVANGFAIEIEDRGLGMTPMRMGELNERLANPPDVNPANTEQLGLFVVGQLARRHGISVVLRPSAYGGTTAVVLIPQRLVVDEATPALTSGPQPAVTGATASAAAAGAAAAFGAAPFGSSGPGGPGGPGGNRPDGLNGFNGSRGPDGPGGPNGFRESGGFGESGGFSESGGFGASGGRRPADGRPGDAFPGSVAPPTPAPGSPSAPAPGRPSAPAPGSPPDLDNIQISSPPFGTRNPFGNGGRGSGPDAGLGGGPGGRRSPDDPVITGVPVTRPTIRPPFGDLPPRRGSDNGSSLPTRGGGSPSSYSSSSFYGSGSAAGDSGGPAPHATSGPGSGSTGSAVGGGEPYGTGAVGPGNGNNGEPGGGYETGNASGTGGEFKGLPRRVRQANLAPQLRTSRDGGESVPQASAPNPADVKNTLSAMQRGWQQGRAQSRRDSEGTDGI